MYTVLYTISNFFMSQKYSVILVTLFISFYFLPFNNNHVLCILLLWLNSYYVIHAYCVMCTVIWVGGVVVYNVGSPLFVCACFMGTPVCVLHAACLNDNW